MSFLFLTVSDASCWLNGDDYDWMLVTNRLYCCVSPGQVPGMRNASNFLME